MGTIYNNANPTWEASLTNVSGTDGAVTLTAPTATTGTVATVTAGADYTGTAQSDIAGLTVTATNGCKVYHECSF